MLVPNTNSPSRGASKSSSDQDDEVKQVLEYVLGSVCQSGKCDDHEGIGIGDNNTTQNVAIHAPNGGGSNDNDVDEEQQQSSLHTTVVNSRDDTNTTSSENDKNTNTIIHNSNSREKPLSRSKGHQRMHSDPVRIHNSAHAKNNNNNNNNNNQPTSSNQYHFLGDWRTKSSSTAYETEREQQPGNEVALGDFDSAMREEWAEAKKRLLFARMHDLEVSREMERENMHLYLSEMLIGVVEQMKWRNVLVSQHTLHRQQSGSYRQQQQQHHQQHQHQQQQQQHHKQPHHQHHHQQQHQGTDRTDNCDRSEGEVSIAVRDDAFGEMTDSGEWYPESEVCLDDRSTTPTTLSSPFGSPSTSRSAISSPPPPPPPIKSPPSSSPQLYTRSAQSDLAHSTLMPPRVGSESSGFARSDEHETLDPRSPEAVAAALLRHFSQKNPNARATGEMEWLVSFADTQQLLLPLPTDTCVAPDEVYAQSRGHSNNAELSKLVRLRGTFEWAPPRKQWIFHMHPLPVKLKPILEKQQYRCAGCGIKLDSKVYARRVRYCDYYGRFFCQCCHKGDKAVIPARVVRQWNFKGYPVCDVASRFLLDHCAQPVFNLDAIDPRLYDRVRPLRLIRQLRVQLFYAWDYVRTCRVAPTVVTKHGNLRSMFDSLPAHWLQDVDVYSLRDLCAVHSGKMANDLEPVVTFAQYHITGCQHCCAQAFVCEYCDATSDLLFPFQLDSVHRCSGCGSLSHLKCFQRLLKKGQVVCQKCLRLEQRRLREQRSSQSGASAVQS